MTEHGRLRDSACFRRPKTHGLFVAGSADITATVAKRMHEREEGIM
jgi:hypothetical protein